MEPSSPDSSAQPLATRIADRQIDLLRQSLATAEAACREGHPVDTALRNWLKGQRKIGSRDRRLIRETVFSYFRWRPWLQQIAEERAQPEAAMLLAGLLSSEFDAPALSRLAEQLDLTGLNADSSCESPQEAAEVLQPLSSKPLHFNDLVPEWYRIATQSLPFPSGPDLWSSRPPVWIRILTGKANAVEAAFQAHGCELQTPHLDLPRSHIALSTFPAAELLKKADGGFLVQDFASQIVTDICRSLPAARWWDACCGAGGKTLALADDGSRHVTASDLRSHAVRELQNRRSLHPPMDIRAVVLDAVQQTPDGEQFDAVLLDAPCTGSGTWGRNPDLKWRTSQADLEERTSLQRALLEQTASAVRTDGWLVYSVCSLVPAEGPDIVQEFLREHPEFQRLEPPRIPDSNDWNRHGCIRPSDGPGNAMFIALLRKTNR